jgi:hypothetical protein
MTELILRGVVGSKAYNLATPESDTDYLGVFVCPTMDLLTLRPPREATESISAEYDFKNYEIKKFLTLALGMNPNIVEFLYLGNYAEKTHWGSALIGLREAFLSRRAISSFSGYSWDQLNKLIKSGNFGSDLKNRQEKHGRHCYRLAIQGLELVATGQLHVALTDKQREECFTAGRLARDDIPVYEKMMVKKLNLFNNVKCVLPEYPDTDKVEGYLRSLRMDYLE